MVINTAAELNVWSREKAAAQLAELDASAATHAVECIASVVWRNAIGQGLRLGDDWGWILDLYGPDEVAAIVQAAAESAAADRSRRRRRGY